MHADIAILGGGIIGSSVAYHLARDGRAGTIVVVERDPTYALAATPRANGGIRLLFSLSENIEMARHGRDFYRAFESEMAVDGEPAPISYKRQGYLFVSDAGGAAQMEENARFQESMGVTAERLDPAALEARFPSISGEGVALAVLSPDDAWIDPQAALMGFRRKARSLGVAYIDGEIVEWQGDGVAARSVTLADGQAITADVFVNACGAWAAEVGRLIDLDLPVEPMSRESYFFRCADPLEPLPFIKTETDLAFRPEGDGYVGGMPDWSEPAGWNFEPSPDRFEDVVWPALAQRLPSMQRVKLIRSWRGHYARNTLDYSAIIGPWSGGLGNVYLANGFSGHGVMHAPATGRALAELILDGGFQTLDLARFGYHRIPAGEPYREKGIV
ncbi:MAG: FAD-binding oxidoreductase [Alphaproteobacteria bacterium]|nr:FAD-binding oxidoreductase [Alphaproteobacteria bacterium]